MMDSYESLIDVEFENFNFNTNNLLQINPVNKYNLTLPEEFLLIILNINENNFVSSIPITNKAVYFGLVSLGVLELMTLKKLGIQREIKNGKIGEVLICNYEECFKQSGNILRELLQTDHFDANPLAILWDFNIILEAVCQQNLSFNYGPISGDGEFQKH
ncbi:hypothetical protein PPL_06032 [Heterostelium album PN500]|uniref:Uncharacterized protein n=1 Tax=Heterostelium pallidum (strain ATCC 26659 / Pp 5 / PN500) TaxID=670386 RepID=D3BC12_HETP5|nr:hypothetical protein PPL_06032 [Heterostelium album PN500]EFA81195.1 hypothetical protein PPL_06032 [Heterostelium album PN500]|eukprot:XP_020433313.1 hypothetical protein PPL_06032 [Heterostelium album PN500]